MDNWQFRANISPTYYTIASFDFLLLDFVLPEFTIDWVDGSGYVWKDTNIAIKE